ncbi:MAG: hypothetical protein WC254_05245, partial [Candidatus Woesearchaeota archaeon]
MKKSEIKTIAILILIIFTLFTIGVSAFNETISIQIGTEPKNTQSLEINYTPIENNFLEPAEPLFSESPELKESTEKTDKNAETSITTADIRDAEGEFIDNTIITDSVPDSTDETIEITFTDSETEIESIVFTDLDSINTTSAVETLNELQVDSAPIPENVPVDNSSWTNVYAIDPSQLNFTEAIVTVNATGTSLYKCKEWNFNEQTCEGTWILFQDNLTPGELYTFELTPNDPGFGEIIAIDALHLDKDYNYISNIYPLIKTSDGTWTEPIYQNEFVRVRFAENLTDGRMIDVYASSNMTYAYFEVYEAGTTHIVGRSGIFAGTELQYIIVSNLTQPTDMFDFKIVKYIHDPTDDSTDVDPLVNSFITFDYVHDDVINATHADGIAVYAESGVQTPRYRTWNSTNNNFSIE